ncbi:MAG: hypothetical protein ACE5IH_04625, partial [Thermodesulfobacteriota bacterium]
MKKRSVCWFNAFLALILVIALTGCGGGGGGGDEGTSGPGPTGGTKTVSGVAAAGAPIIGYVYLKDYTGTILGPNEINVDGSFSFDVTGLTAPFYLRADGAVGSNGYDLYSVATGEGTANINPLTSITVAAAANVNDPASVYNDPASYSMPQTALDQAVADIQSMLQPLLDAYNANVNPITDSFTADHTGLDGLFDLVAVDVDTSTGTTTVTDNLTGTQIGNASTGNIANPTDTVDTGEVPAPQTLTDLQTIAVMLSDYATELNKGTNLTAADLEPFYATNYGINNGRDRTQWINEEVMGIGSMTAIKTITSITNLTIAGQTSNGDYIIDGIAYFSDGSFGFPNEGFIVTNENGPWKLKGNGFMSRISFNAQTHRWIKADGSMQTESSIQFRIYDEGNFGLQSAVITGPGLPQGGISMSKEGGAPTDLTLDPSYRNNAIPS